MSPLLVGHQFPRVFVSLWLFDDLWYWHGWSLSNSLVQPTFEENQNVLGKILPAVSCDILQYPWVSYSTPEAPHRHEMPHPPTMVCEVFLQIWGWARRFFWASRVSTLELWLLFVRVCCVVMTIVLLSFNSGVILCLEPFFLGRKRQATPLSSACWGLLPCRRSKWKQGNAKRGLCWTCHQAAQAWLKMQQREREKSLWKLFRATSLFTKPHGWEKLIFTKDVSPCLEGHHRNARKKRRWCVAHRCSSLIFPEHSLAWEPEGDESNFQK